jgi:hypothetical protein
MEVTRCIGGLSRTNQPQTRLAREKRAYGPPSFSTTNVSA